MTMKHQRRVAGVDVGAIGLGCMGMSWAYAEGSRDDRASEEVVRAAVDAGATFLDTSDIYGCGHNEALLGRALVGRRDEVLLATKGGLVVDALATFRMHRDGRPERLRRAIDASLQRLRTDRVDLYYLHRIDPSVPVEESWGAMAELVAAGKVGHLGLSEVTVDEARRAHEIHPVAAVQSEFSLWTREPMERSRGGDSLLDWTAGHGAVLVPFAPLGRGFLTGAISATTDFEPSDFRSANPRFAVEARVANERIVEAVRAVATRRGVTAAQVALAWTLAQGPHVVPIPGTRRASHLTDNLAAADLVLDAADLALLDAIPGAVGERY